MSKCHQIFREGVRDGEYEIEKVIRLGKINTENKPRPLLVKLKNKIDKYRLLGKAKNLKYCRDELKKVIVAPDLTLKEREHDRKLRNELKQKREAGENNWFIHRGELKQRNF